MKIILTRYEIEHMLCEKAKLVTGFANALKITFEPPPAEPIKISEAGFLGIPAIVEFDRVIIESAA